MPSKRRPRKQRVVLRLRHRDALKHRLRVVLWRSVLFAVAGGFVLGLTAGGDSYLARFLREHTPVVDVKAPAALTALPLAQELPSHPFLLWFPGMGVRAGRRWIRQYPAVRDVRFERHFTDNRIVVRVEPRTPLARWNDRGIDDQGVLFPLGPGTWTELPTIRLNAGVPSPVVGRWLGELSRGPDLWSQVAAVESDARGGMILTTRTGTVVSWGDPDLPSAREKAQWLCRVLQDAHEHLGGAARADLRFFDEGRIIVRPKSAV